MPRRPNIINELCMKNKQETDNQVSTTTHNLTDSFNHTEIESNMIVDSGHANSDLMSKVKMDILDDDANKKKQGGRRKQSKPIRVFVDLEEGRPEVPPTQATTDESMVLADSVSAETNQQQEEMEVDHVENSENLASSKVLPNQGEINSDLASTPRNSELNGMEGVEVSPESYPTKYHKLGSELQQTNPTQQVINIEPTNEAASPDMPQPASGTEDNEEEPGRIRNDGSSRNSRIFHRDAYCELCDREFCNKYFLKTHKANKHGVFDGSPTTVGGGPGSAFGPPSVLGQPTSFPTMVPLSGPLPQSTLPEPTILNVPMPASQEKLPTTSAVHVTIPQPVTPKSSSPSSITSVSRSFEETPKKVPIDMEDYCEICQKHFCNKYYLRKHKQDVHGIVPETPPTKRGRPATTGLSSGPPSLTTTASTSLPVIPPMIPSLPSSFCTSSSSAFTSAPSMTTMANLMFINPFAPPVAIIQAQQPLSGLPGPNPGFFPQGIPQLAQLPPPPPSSSAETSPKSSLPSSVSPKNMSMPNDALRSIGVLNADAYCELCRKEFCNKYFLKIHKANKHGIFTDDLFSGHPGGQLLIPFIPPGAGDFPAALALEAAQAAQAQAFAANAEAAALAKSEEKDKAKSEEKKEDYCDLCHREFGSKYSLKIHQLSVHGLKLSDADTHEMGEMKIKSEYPPLMLPGADMGMDPATFFGDIKAHLNPDGTINNTMFNTMVAAKLADRVLCDICNKEVCNKYFLKTHKMKVHGIDPNTLRDLDINKSDSKSSIDISELIKPHAPVSEMTLNGSLSDENKKPKDGELLKMGIDPEAYCEICRKEFCSKYFLKTHKLNIHGIKDITSVITTSVPIPTTPTPVAPMTIPVAPMTTPSPSATISPTAMDQANPGGEHHSWKWKEPINATRVMCEICNKELCNKYFLKTHMLKKHGINFDVITGIASAAPIKGWTPPKDSDSNSMDSLGSSKEFNQKPDSTKGMDMYDDKMISAKTWHVPQDYTKLIDRNGEIIATDLSVTDERNKDDTFFKKCEFCGLLFGETLTLQLHILQDHKGQVESRCAKENNENKVTTSNGNGAVVKKRFGKGKRKRRSGHKMNQNGAGIGEKTKSAIVNHIQNHQKKKKFRCAQCHTRFQTREACVVHIRASHPKQKVNGIQRSKNTQQVQDTGSQVNLPNGGYLVNKEESRGLPISMAKIPFELPKDTPVTMQPFTVKPENGEEDNKNFETAIVYLPVHKKVAEPVTMSFTLTPTAESN